MARAGRNGLRIEQELAVERALQNRFQTLIGEGLQLDGTLAGGFQSWLGVYSLQTQNTQAGTVTHLGVRLALQDGADDFSGGRADSFGPMNQPGRCPCQVRLVALGHMLRHGCMAIGGAATRVGSDSFSTMKDLYSESREAGL
jgi:hypothetical protein